MLVALLVTVYLTDVASAKRWDGIGQAARISRRPVQHQALLKTVARHRPDMLELLTEINAGQNDGIVLDSLHFKKGQTVTLAGQAGNTEQMWKFQANLREQKEIKDAEISNATPGQQDQEDQVHDHLPLQGIHEEGRGVVANGE